MFELIGNLVINIFTITSKGAAGISSRLINKIKRLKAQPRIIQNQIIQNEIAKRTVESEPPLKKKVAKKVTKKVEPLSKEEQEKRKKFYEDKRYYNLICRAIEMYEDRGATPESGIVVNGRNFKFKNLKNLKKNFWKNKEYSLEDV